MNQRTFRTLLVTLTLSAAPALAQPAKPLPDRPAPVTPAPALAGAAAPRPVVDEAAAVLAPQPGGLTSAQVADRTSANSTSVQQRLAEVDIARARVAQTTAQFFPTLTFRASYTRLSAVNSGLGSGSLVGALHPGQLTVGPCPQGQCVLDSQGQPVAAQAFEIGTVENNYALTATLNVPLSDYVLRLSNAAAGSSANRRSAELQVKAERLKVRADAQALFYEWLRALARVAIAEKSLERTRARLKDAGPAFELGTITRADVMRLEALQASTEQVLIEARSFRDLTERQLAILMNEEPGSGYRVGEDIGVPLAPLPGRMDALTTRALRTRLELRALHEAARSARLGARAVRAGVLPRVDAFGDVTYANPNQRYFPPQERWRATWSVGVAATWTVGDAFNNSAQARELEANARALAAQREALADGIRQEVAQQYLARAQGDAALFSAEREVAASQEAYRVAIDLYRVGRATTTEVIEAETDLLAARLNHVNARLQKRIAEVRLRHAVGHDIPPERAQ
ncbi:MAG TPA: TolC family protein [Polyangiaceae bacterium]|nr:TolC family protein [Polyangiaceae bacterium]